jgi:hypothetical protein
MKTWSAPAAALLGGSWCWAAAAAPVTPLPPPPPLADLSGGPAEGASLATLTVALCLDDGAETGRRSQASSVAAAVEGELGRRLGADGWIQVRRGCEQPGPGSRDPPMISLAGSVVATNEAGVVWQTRLAVSPLRRRPILVNGRSFPPDTRVFHVEFPPVVLDRRGPAQRLPEMDVVEGLARAFAYEADSVDLRRQAALTLLRRWDEGPGAGAAPDVSALVKQARGLLLLDARCDDVETAAELLADAARLVPYRAETRMLAGLARLSEIYAPGACVVVAERALLDSLKLDPWSTEAVDRLGAFYELMVTAPPGTLSSAATGSREAANDRLESTWAGRAPRGPRAIEIGGGVSLGETSAGAPVQGLAPGLRGEVTFGRDGTGLGLRIAANLPWFREISLQPGFVTWARYTASVGPRYRRHLDRFYGEGSAAAVVAYVLATGKDYHPSYSSSAADLGAELAVRAGVRFSRLALWMGATGTWWVGDRVGSGSALRIDVANLEEHPHLPTEEVAALAGLSFFLWAEP